MKLSDAIEQMQQLAKHIDGDPDLILYDRDGDGSNGRDIKEFEIMRGDAEIVLEF